TIACLPRRPVVCPLNQNAAATNDLLPQFQWDRWKPQEPARPIHPGKAQSALPVAAIVREFAARFESASARWTDPPDKRTLQAPWLTQVKRPVRVRNSALAMSR